MDLTEKMNKLRDALLHARTAISTQQARNNQLTSELVRAKQSRISNDHTGE
jgi:flagellar biosynthesis/type III secretory pathway chaperone